MYTKSRPAHTKKISRPTRKYKDTSLVKNFKDLIKGALERFGAAVTGNETLQYLYTRSDLLERNDRVWRGIDFLSCVPENHAGPVLPHAVRIEPMHVGWWKILTRTVVHFGWQAGITRT